VDSTCPVKGMATHFDLHILLEKEGWSPPSSTAQASMRIIKTKAGRQFIGKYKNSKANNITKELQMMMHPFRPVAPLDCPLSIEIIYRFAYRKSEPRKNLDNEYMPHTTRPDSDNLLKLLLDSMNGVFFKDDSLLSKVSFYKQRGKRPLIDIKLFKI
jgi:Holliday junction resolvase RusA-like endonuclease